MNRITKKILLIILDVIIVFSSIAISFKFTSTPILHNLPTLLIYSAITSLILVILFSLLKLYRGFLRYTSAYELLKIVTAIMMLSFLELVFGILSSFKFVKFTTLVISILFISVIITISRFSYRLYFIILENGINGIKNPDNGKSRVMIIGGGESCNMLIREMKSSNKISKNAVCIIDDDPLKLKNEIYGVSIVGNRYSIIENAIKYNIDEIILAIPSINAKDKKEILDICKKTSKKVLTLPGIYDLVNGNVSLSKIREVEISDLLGREQVKVNIDEIIGYIDKKTILVTGGGGSIGSELCRQIASHNPKRLIIVDIYENNAYDIEQELKRKYPFLDLVVLIASIRDKTKVNDIFNKYHPDIVFNAAAHKHVPLMENSPNEAIKNNVFGTLNVARAAVKYNTSKFVQISTDKAVNPTNIMGASKRLCEMIIQAIGKTTTTCDFVAVRFGNVLGSNGSVIPLFKKQIIEGGPVTVTHPDIIRYFMTIPEAVSLVLQAGAYAKKGQIFVLDMGEPVKIYDLACNLIRLSGYIPNETMEIKITGLRPGEKLYEERLMSEEGLEKTANGLISIAKPIDFDEKTFFDKLDKLYEAATSESNSMKYLVSELVTTYKVSN